MKCCIPIAWCKRKQTFVKLVLKIIVCVFWRIIYSKIFSLCKFTKGRRCVITYFFIFNTKENYNSPKKKIILHENENFKLIQVYLNILKLFIVFKEYFYK